MNKTQTNRLFSLDIAFKHPLQNKLFSLLKGPLERVLRFPRLNQLYDDLSRMPQCQPFPDKVLKKLNVTVNLTPEDMNRLMIPVGPVIILANHPFGGIDGIILASLLRSCRRDVKFMSNYMLNTIPEMREMIISVNPFQGGNAIRENIKPIRECIQWVNKGGMLVVFPAGAVSHFHVRKRVITDPAWSPTIARIIRKTGAPVLPVFFQGANSIAFHVAGMVHPLLRTAMLPNELLNKNRKNIRMCVGDLVPFATLQDFNRDENMTTYLRLRTYVLEHRNSKGRPPGITAFIRKGKQETIGIILPPPNPDIMAREISQFPPEQTLINCNEFAVFQATAGQIPHILLEIGRLREIAFRAVGEGTGKAVDIDLFDHSYTHLFIWNREKKEVIGACRLGKTDEIIRHMGLHGLYSSTLFNYKTDVFEQLGPALEMGRSFLRPEYQKTFTPLVLLWKGIGRFIVDNPQYKTLFGPVSISNDYKALSKELLIRYLKTSRYRSDIADFISPKKPFHARRLKGWEIEAAVALLNCDMDTVSELIASMESDRKGMPVLMKQYLKMGGEIVGFNVDTAFSNVVDGLIIVDLTKTETRILDRYMGKLGARAFMAYHEAPTQDCLRAIM